jgi:hypothetical protein
MTILLILLAIVLFPVSIPALVLMLCWNFLDSSLFHLHAITFWQAFALVFLVGLVGNLFRKS